MYPQWTEQQIASIIIGGGSAIILTGAYIYLKDKKYIMDHTIVDIKSIPMTAIKDESAENHEEFLR